MNTYVIILYFMFRNRRQNQADAAIHAQPEQDNVYITYMCMYTIYLKKQANKVTSTLLEAGAPGQNRSAPSNCCTKSK